MQRQVNIHAAKTHLSGLLAEVAAGDEIVIARSGEPVARSVPYQSTNQPREPGIWRGKPALNPNFDTLPADMEAAFRGERS